MLHLPHRLHKRPLFVFLTILAIIIFIAAVMVLEVGRFANSTQVTTITLDPNKSMGTVGGTGINLPFLPSNNFLHNASFEDSTLFQVQEIAGIYEQKIYLKDYLDASSPFSPAFSNSFFNEGRVRFLALDQNGKAIEKLESQIADYQINQLGLWNKVILPLTDLKNRRILAIESSTNLTVGVGEAGLIIYGLGGSDPVVVDLNFSEDIIDIAFNQHGFLALSREGSFLSSSDGRSWKVHQNTQNAKIENTQEKESITVSNETEESFVAHGVALVGKTGFSFLENGTINLLVNGEILPLDSYSTLGERILTSSSEGEILVIAGKNNLLKSSSNGVVFTDLKDKKIEEKFSSEAKVIDWQSSDIIHNNLVITSAAGDIAFWDLATHTKLFQTQNVKDKRGEAIYIKDVMWIDTNKLLLLDWSGHLFLSVNQGHEWLKLNFKPLDSIHFMATDGNEKLLLVEENLIYMAGIYNEITISDSYGEELLSRGDISLLEKSQNFLDASTEELLQITQKQSKVLTENWKKETSNTNWEISPDVPSNGGKSSLLLKSPITTEIDLTIEQNSQKEVENHSISQKIALPKDLGLKDNTVYRIQLWLKQEDVLNQEVMVWLTGNFKEMGTTFNQVGNGWREYSYSFLPSSDFVTNQSSEFYFNIGFKGEGKIWIDNVFFSYEAEANHFIPEAILEAFSKVEANYIRLGHLPFGILGRDREAWFLSGGNEAVAYEHETYDFSGNSSLDDALNLIVASKANPWLVVDSVTSPKTIEGLMGYLNGNMSDPFGKKRIDNGTLVPWGIQFDKIIIEISDQNELFVSDLARSAFVDYIINLFKTSPYYLSIKDKLIFVDGMNYSAKTMLSNGDYHTSALKMDHTSFSSLTWSEAVSKSYQTFYDQIPRFVNRPSQSGDEWIFSGQYNDINQDSKTVPPTEKDSLLNSLTIADYGHLFLYDLGQYSFCYLTDLNFNSQNAAFASSALLWHSPSQNNFSYPAFEAENKQKMLAVLSILNEGVKGNKIFTSVTHSPLSPEEESVNQDLKVYGFMDQDNLYCFVLNLNETLRAFQLDSSVNMQGSVVKRYSSQGEYLEEYKLRSGHKTINIQAGQILLITQKLN